MDASIRSGKLLVLQQLQRSILKRPVSVRGSRSFVTASTKPPASSQLEDHNRTLKPSANREKGQRTTYLLAVIASSSLVTSLSAAAVHYKFMRQIHDTSGGVPAAEIFGTLSLALGAAVGMEFWARWAHKELWHSSLWSMHKSHHTPRKGPFELNDIFAIVNAAPAIALMAYGFFNEGLLAGLCFGAGLGITVFGIAYMFIHDGLVHRRFAVGPIANIPYFQKLAAAHQLHHANLCNGVPFGLFLAPKEVEEVVGGLEAMDKLLKMKNQNPS